MFITQNRVLWWDEGSLSNASLNRKLWITLTFHYFCLIHVPQPGNMIRGGWNVFPGLWLVRWNNSIALIGWHSEWSLSLWYEYQYVCSADKKLDWKLKLLRQGEPFFIYFIYFYEKIFGWCSFMCFHFKWNATFKWLWRYGTMARRMNQRGWQYQF